MDERTRRQSLPDPARFNVRLFDIETAAEYLSMGRTRARAWLVSVGALRKFGSRSLYDRKVIDRALDALEAPEVET